jgi:predicted transcriptional regulator of viral defense system
VQIIYGMMKGEKYEYIDDYLLYIRSKGRFSFTFDELKNTFDSSEQAIRKKISRLKADSKITAIRKDFYVVLPPEYTENGTLPVYLYIDDLMKYLRQDYYIGLFSAAALYGAAHQQPMEYQVIVQKPMRDLVVGDTKLIFFSRKTWEPDTIEKKKSAAGYFNVSSAELTALDFMSFNGKIGSISRIVTILQELIDEIKPSQMYKVASTYPQISALQRIGYLFDKVFDRGDLAKSIQRILKEKTTQNIVLSISSPKKGKIDRDWKVDVNVEIVNDL